MTDHSETLGSYKGHPVTGTKIVVKGIGDGLSNPVAIDPIVIEPGHTAFLAVRVSTSKHRYEFEKDGEGKVVGAILVQEFVCSGAMFADEKLVGAAIQKLVDRLKEEEARKKGQLTLGIDIEGEDETNVSDISSAKKRRRKVEG